MTRFSYNNMKGSVSPESKDFSNGISMVDGRERYGSDSIVSLFKAKSTPIPAVVDMKHHSDSFIQGEKNVRLQSVYIDSMDGDVGATMLEQISSRTCQLPKSRIAKHLRLNGSFLNTVQFPSEKVEKLYKRYFFRLNQSFVNWLLVVLVIVTSAEVGLHFAYNSETDYKYSRGILLSVQVAIYSALLILINWTGSSGKLLIIVSYTLVLIGCVTIILNLALVPDMAHSVTESLSFTMFLIYMTYVMLPLRIRVAVFCGLLLTITHLVAGVASRYNDPNITRLVRVNLCLANMGHLVTH